MCVCGGGGGGGAFSPSLPRSYTYALDLVQEKKNPKAPEPVLGFLSFMLVYEGG